MGLEVKKRLFNQENNYVLVSRDFKGKKSPPGSLPSRRILLNRKIMTCKLLISELCDTCYTGDM